MFVKLVVFQRLRRIARRFVDLIGELMEVTRSFAVVVERAVREGLLDHDLGGLNVALPERDRRRLSPEGRALLRGVGVAGDEGLRLGDC